MSIKILDWDMIYTSCGLKPCFYFKPTLELSEQLLEKKTCFQNTRPVKLEGTGRYDGIQRVMFDKSNLDNLVFIGIVQTPYDGSPPSKGDFELYKEEYYDKVPSVENFEFLEKKRKKQEKKSLNIGIIIVIAIAFILICMDGKK